MTEPDLAVSVVSYRTPELLRACLEALARERDSLELEITVVDNASGDGSAELVARDFPNVRVLRNARNVGFGAGHNQALRRSRARALLVLNSDATVRPGALRTLVDYLDAHPDVAVVGPRLVYPDGRAQRSMRRFPTVWTLFFESTQLQRFWPSSSFVRRYYALDWRDDVAREVDWLVGACLCVRSAAAAQVGLYDERFFLYSEELDWARRFRAAGWRIVYLPTAEVEHHEGASARQDLAARDQLFQMSKLAYAAKWHGPRVAAALRAYLVVEYVLRLGEEALKLALGSRVAERRARLRVIKAGLRSIVSARTNDRSG